MKLIYNFKSPNFDRRKPKSKIKYIILHYTAMGSIRETIEHLCNKKSMVSCHYLISKKGKIYRLVNDEKRAWHAGKSNWKNVKDINSHSLGIELQNTGHLLKFENYGKYQIDGLILLLKILKKKYNIGKSSILGHSDVAPLRKIDPGEKFPWKLLNEHNLVYIPKSDNKIILEKKKKLDLKNILIFKKKLKKIGYNIKINKKNDIELKKFTKAFQMHFQQNFVTGYPNKESLNIAKKLCKVDY